MPLAGILIGFAGRCFSTGKTATRQESTNKITMKILNRITPLRAARQHCALALAAAGMIGAGPSAQAQTVANSSFETPSLGAGGFQYNPGGASWSFGNAGVTRNGGPWYSPDAPDGVQGGFIQTDGGSISQSIPFAAAGDYTVSFAVVGRAGYGSRALSVKIDGITVYALTAAQISTAAWASQTTPQFTVTAGAHTLAFVTGAGGDASVIDNVVINTVPQNTADILTFGLPGYPAVITGTDIAWTVPFSWNAAALAPTFTMPYGATAAPVSGTLRDFTSPQTYTLNSGDGTSVVNQMYTVTVTNAAVSTAKDLLTFVFPGLPAGIISGTNISVTVPGTTDITTLAPTYTLSPLATCVPASGSPVDFTSPQNYTVTAEDHSTQVYTVTVSLAPVETAIAWNLNGGGAWDTTSLNWLGQVSNSPTFFANGANVIFNKTAGGTIAIAPGMSPASTTVSGSGNYTLTGGPIAGGALTVSGSGQLSLQTTPANFSSIVLNGGSIWLRADVYGVGACNMGNVTINSGATLQGERANMVGGALTMNGGRYMEDNGFGGSWTGPVYLAADSFFGQNGWCCQQTINGTISGPGGFTFSTQYGATLILNTANSYAGPTIVTGGTVQCNVPDALGANALTIASGGAKVNLNYSGDHVVSALTLGGVSKPAGTYGSTSSPAPVANQSAYFSGTGTVTVPAASAYDAWANGTFANGATVSDKDPAHDPDGDGMTNQQEFAFGLDPTTGASANPITQQLDKATGAFKYTRTKDSGLTYIYQSSTTLREPWDDFTPDSAVSNNATPVEEITVTVPANLLLNSKLFLRVKAQ